MATSDRAAALRAQATAARAFADALEQEAAAITASDSDLAPARRPLLTLNELATELRRSTSMIHRDMRTGLPHSRVGDAPRFDLDEVRAWYTARAAEKRKGRRVRSCDDAPPVRLSRGAA